MLSQEIPQGFPRRLPKALARLSQEVPPREIPRSSQEIPQGDPQGPPSRTQGLPRRPQGLPRRPQSFPKRSQGLPRRAQGLPKAFPKGPPRRSLRLQRASSKY